MKPIYIVLIVNLVVWAGVFALLLSLDSRIKKLEKH